MKSVDSDVIIIGAGPAGLTTARTLADNDIDFILLSKEDSPCTDKACGGFVPLRAVEEFDLGEINGSHPILSVRMKFPGTKMKRVDFKKPIGINVSRGELGTRMLELVGGLPGSVSMNSYVSRLSTGIDWS